MLHLFFPTSDGSPRYFSCCLMIFTPNLCLISSCKFCGVLRLKKREVFSQFSCWPKAFSYFSKIPIKLEHSSPVALQKIRPSSAKNRHEIDGPLAHAAIPFIVPSFTDFLIRAERPPAQNKKR